jgi:hypothetical protein
MSPRLRDRPAPRGDRGAALVEFALVLPLITALLLGIFEYGNAWRQVGTLERAAQQGARTVTQQANGRFADYEALRSVDSATRGMAGVEVTRVVIYRVTNPDGTVPGACLSGSVGGLCNTYSGAQARTTNPAGFVTAGGSGNPTCGGGSWDAGWCPTSRPRSDTSPLRIGVHVTVDYTPVTGMIPGPTMTISRTAVYQIEPCARGQSEC